MGEHEGESLELTLLVLRRMSAQRHQLARAMTGRSGQTPEGVWWELVDASAAADLPPSGVALTCIGPGGRVTVAALGVPNPGSTSEYSELLRALLAALRRQAADEVIVCSADRHVVEALLEVGFGHAPHDGSDDCYLTAL
ncbi:MAG: hypothetical protein WAL50_03535 [Kineosporiaceae bacterium]|jgi:predicted neutral ceramidase superfamily lipid hydrolase